ncbi:MAG: phosphatidylglycerophosphatase A, partial [Kordiimonadaceae bacterium]|nr:phosphatidylglycerophosphatase A [Kordiimonadaceae bacterium]
MVLKNWNKSFFHPSLWLSTWFYSGLIPFAPGTFGSIAALPFAWFIIDGGGKIALILATIIIFVVGLWASKEYMSETGKTDPGEVVIDEVVGQWMVCLLIV